MFAVERAYLIPDFLIEVELMSEAEFASSAVASSVMRARLDHFEWAGSHVTTGFGLRLFGVDIFEPEKISVPTAFVPLHAVDLRLAA